MQCIFQDDICTIAGVCYELGALNMLNTEEFCNTTTSRTTWSTLIGKQYMGYSFI